MYAVAVPNSLNQLKMRLQLLLGVFLALSSAALAAVKFQEYGTKEGWLLSMNCNIVGLASYCLYTLYVNVFELSVCYSCSIVSISCTQNAKL